MLGGLQTKRLEALDFLKAILNVCGESISLEMVWLNKAESTTSDREDDYQLVIKSSGLTLDNKCFSSLTEKYKLIMKKHGEIWIFSKE